MIESLTYAELGQRLGISPEAARKKAKAARLPSTLGNDGKRRVSVDFCELRHTRRPAGDRPQQSKPDVRAGQLDELREEIARTYVQAAIEASLQERIRSLETLLEEMRADRDAWRAQAQRSWWRRLVG